MARLKWILYDFIRGGGDKLDLGKSSYVAVVVLFSRLLLMSLFPASQRIFPRFHLSWGSWTPFLEAPLRTNSCDAPKLLSFMSRGVASTITMIIIIISFLYPSRRLVCRALVRYAPGGMPCSITLLGTCCRSLHFLNTSQILHSLKNP